MITFEKNYKRIKDIYNILVDNIIKSYSIMTRKSTFKMAKKDVIVSFDRFFSACIIDAILRERPLQKGELNKISSIVKYSDLTKDFEISKDEVLTELEIEALNASCHKVLTEFPAFFTMGILIDNEIDFNVGHDTTFTSLLYSKLKEVIKLTSDVKHLHRQVLKNVVDVFVMNHIAYN